MEVHTHGLQEELEKVQNRAARFVTGNYVFETGSMTGILGQLKWKSLKKRRKESRLTQNTAIQRSEGSSQNTYRRPYPEEINTLWHFRFQLAKKRTKVVSFHRVWNDLPDFLVSSAEMSDDCLSNFTSLVRARDWFPSWRTPGKVLSVWKVTSKPFRFRFRDLCVIRSITAHLSRQFVLIYIPRIQ